MSVKYNDFEREKVPVGSLKSWWDILAVQFGFIFGSSALVWAMKFTKGLNFKDTIIVLTIGHFLVYWVFYFNGKLGIRERLSTFFIVRQSFGTIGSAMVAILTSFALVGWMGAQVGATSSGISAATGWNVTVLNIFIGLAMTLTAAIGFKALKKLSDISVPYFLIICVVAIFVALKKIGSMDALFNIQPSSSMSLVTAISAVIGSIVVMGVIVPDISRYARSEKDLNIALIVSFVVGHIVIPVSGVLMALAIGSSNIGFVIFQLIGWAGVLMLILSGWTTGDNDIYSASLALASVIPNVPKWKLASLIGIFGTIAAVAGIINHIIFWLVLLSSLAPPIFGVMQADYWILPLFGIERGLALKGKKIVNWAGVLSWLCGCVVAYKIPFGVGAINGVITSFVLYILISTVWVKSTGKSPSF